MNEVVEFQLPDLEATRALAQSIAVASTKPLTISLIGTLGAGKTQFVRYFAEALGVPPEEVTSPTYVLLQRYAATTTIYHFDFYRLESNAQVWDLGIDELFEQPVWVLIEWADKFPECLPGNQLQLEIDQGDDGRLARVSAAGGESEHVLTALSEHRKA